MKLIFTLIFTGLLFTSFSQHAPGVEWMKQFGGSGDDYAASVHQTFDGGYIVAGTTFSDDGDFAGNHGGGDCWVARLNKKGAVQWKKFYGGSQYDDAACILQTKDSGFILVGGSSSNDGDVTGNHGLIDVWVLKLNKKGNITWQESLGGIYEDEGKYISAVTDGGYIITGYTRESLWVIKIDANGELQWQKPIIGRSTSYGNCTRETSDGGYIVCGYTNSDTCAFCYSGGWDWEVVKLTNTGSIQWQKIFGSSGFDYANSVVQTQNGNFTLAGSSGAKDSAVNCNKGEWDGWVVRLDANGNMKWQKCLGGSNLDYMESIIKVKGGYVVAGTTQSNNGDVTKLHGGRDIWVLRLNNRGGIIWQECVGKNSSASDIAKTSDGGYIVAGSIYNKYVSQDSNSKSSDAWIVKLASDSLYAPANEDEDYQFNEVTPADKFAIKIYPNPAKDILHITGLSGYAKKISIINAQGQIFYSKVTSNTNYSINITQLNSGMYFINIQENSKMVTLKFYVAAGSL